MFYRGLNKTAGRGETIEKVTREFEEAVSIQFEVYCKRTILHEFADIKRAARRRKANKEVSLSNLDKDDAQRLQRLSAVPETMLFFVDDYEIPIVNDRLADGLLRLSERQRQILLLGICCGLSDKMIADKLKVPRSTVQYQRTKAIRIMQAYIGHDKDGGIQT